MRACCSPLEEPVGKESATDGLLTAWPAATFAFSDCRRAQARVSR